MDEEGMMTVPNSDSLLWEGADMERKGGAVELVNENQVARLLKKGRENLTMRLNRLGCCHVGKKDYGLIS